MHNLQQRTKARKKQIGLYKVQSIDNPKMIIIAIKTEEYFEQYGNRNFNKKHKGVRNNARVWTSINQS